MQFNQSRVKKQVCIHIDSLLSNNQKYHDNLFAQILKPNEQNIY